MKLRRKQECVLLRRPMEKYQVIQLYHGLHPRLSLALKGYTAQARGPVPRPVVRMWGGSRDRSEVSGGHERR